MKMRHPCAACKGAGWIYAPGTEYTGTLPDRCEDCEGRGEVQVNRPDTLALPEKEIPATPPLPFDDDGA